MCQSAYPSAPSPFPYDEAKALQTYVKNETKSLLRVCLQSSVAIEGEIPSPDADTGSARQTPCKSWKPFQRYVLFFFSFFSFVVVFVFCSFNSPSGLAELQNLSVTGGERIDAYSYFYNN